MNWNVKGLNPLNDILLAGPMFTLGNQHPMSQSSYDSQSYGESRLSLEKDGLVALQIFVCFNKFYIFHIMKS